MKNNLDDPFDLLLDGTSLDLTPGVSDELKSMKSLAGSIASLPPPEINQLAMSRTLLAVEQAAEVKPGAFTHLFKPAFVLRAAGYMVAILVSASVVGSAAYSLPGSWLYPIKLMNKKIAYTLKPGIDGKAELSIVFSEESLNDLKRKFNNDNQIDQKLLAALLTEAQNGLKLSEQLPPEKQAVYRRKCAELAAHQSSELARMHQCAAAGQKPVIKGAMDCCEQMSRNMTKCP